MAQNNLRVIFQNLADTSTLSVSSTAGAGTPVTNLLKDTKSLVYRSASSVSTTIKANIVCSFTERSVGGPNSGIGIILAFTNLTSSATIKVSGYTGALPTAGSGTAPVATAGAVLKFSSTVPVLCAPYQSSGYSNWNNDPFYTTNISTTRYKDRKVYARVWVPIPVAVPCSSLLIEISDTNVNQYIEASRLVVGSYWTPKFNTSYGISSGTKDTSTSNRSESGDLLTTPGTMYNTLSFDLKWLTKEDRSVFNKIIKLCGIQRPLFVSLFPDNEADWEKEQLYQIYGKFSQLSNIGHGMPDMYDSQVDIEEI